MEPPTEGIPPEQPKTIEESARETLSGIYVLGEAFLLDSAIRQIGVRTRIGETPEDPTLKEDLRRLQYETGNEQNQFRGQTGAIGEEIILLFVPGEDQRNAIRKAALITARAFWENKLEEPDLLADVVMLGRRRITQISQKLEDLSRPPETA